MATFWSTVARADRRSRGSNAVLTDGTDEHTLWLNRVPEPRSVKQRVHLDVHTADVAALQAAGPRWPTTPTRGPCSATPRAGEFCAFVRPPDRLPDYRLYEVVVDAVDPPTIAAWWAERFAATVQTAPEHEFCWLEPVSGLPGRLVFNPVPEPKIGKNRVHWDVWADADALVAVGATLIRRRDHEIGWDVLADPEGNEFCVFPRS